MEEDFGSYLKAERELRGVTLEELYTKTKIPMHYLQALEKNQFDKLPEEVFIKGYIRSFAKVIGADENELLSAYIDITKAASPIETNNQNNLNQSKFTLDPKFIFILIFIILVLSVAVWGVTILIRNFNTDSITSTPAAVQQKKSAAKGKLEKTLPLKNLTGKDVSNILTNGLASKTPTINSNTNIQSSATSLSEKPSKTLKNSLTTMSDENTPEKLKETSTASSTDNSMPLELTLKINNDVWVSIAVDDSPVEDFLLAKGSEKIFYGKKQYVLNVGNQSSVDLALNGTLINFPETNKEDVVKNFIINSQLVE